MERVKTVIKRDNRRQSFSKARIYAAILGAALETYPDCTEKELHDDVSNWTEYVVDMIEERYGKQVHIEDIQDSIEQVLMNEDKFVAKNYITYRYRHELARDRYSSLMELVKEKLSASNVQNQNANVDEKSFGGRKGEVTDLILKKLAIEDYLSPMAALNHTKNLIYEHDLGDFVVGSHNCFEPSTRFITSEGVKSFNDFEDGDVITVLTPSGVWRKATVNYHGKQKLLSYTFKKNKTEIVIKATKDHRWININGDFQEGLSVNDKLLDSPWFWESFDFDDLSLLGKEYWCYGFIMGDGTLETRYSKKEKKYYKPNTTKVKLCKDKAKYLYRFQEIGYGLNCYVQEPEITGIKYDKTIPDFTNLPLECLISFIHGLYDADGTHSFSASTGKPIYSIQFTSKELCDFVEKYFPVAGLYINSIKEKTGQQTNFAIRGYTKNYQFFGQHSSKFNWYVKDITQEDDDLHDVWCLNVEDEHAFVLENGISTGNCLTIPFDDLLMLGFDTRQTDIRPANSVGTAFQLLAVIFQLESLQQFGGVSASHLDWTMVPYVRKSFYKHYCDGMKYIEGNIPVNKPNKPISYLSIQDSWYASDVYEKVYQYALDMTKKEIEQAVEGMYHNLNTLQSRSGNQLPFTSINYGTCTLLEGQMIIEALLRGSIKGVGKHHKTPVFPCGIFQCMKGVNRKPGDPNYGLFRLALESTARRLYPNYCNVDWSINAGYDRNDPRTYTSTMGERKLSSYKISLTAPAGVAA